jgi:soluble lytic murein transglycosylase
MRVTAACARVACAILACALLVPATREAARAETAPSAAEPSSGAPAESAALPGGEKQGFDPATVWLGEDAPETRALAAIARGANADARRIVDKAMRGADPARRGRLLWLRAKATDNDAVRRADLEALAKSEHPLRRWAALDLAERLRASAPVRAVGIVEGLREGWAGAARARRLHAQWSPPPTAVESASADAASSGADPAKSARASDAPSRGPSADDELARGKSLAAAFRYQEAERAFAAVAAHPEVTPAQRCDALLGQGRAMSQRRARKDAATLLAQVAEECAATEVKAAARYLAGQALLRSGDPQGAKAHYDALRREAPEHSLADDALFAEAQACQDAGDAEGARKAFQRVVETYPRGDMCGEARLRLAFDARVRRAHDEALAQLDALVVEGGADVDEGAEGRAAYWRARTLEEMGRLDEADRAYADLARAWPLSFHAQQGLLRLRARRAARADALAAEWTSGARDGGLRFVPRPELASEGFAAAIELLRVGEVSLALREFGEMGALEPATDAELRWLVAALLHHARAHGDAVNLVRRRFVPVRRTMPQGYAFGLWRIGYPHAFAPMVERAAHEGKVPAALMRALAREESSFDPGAVSPAGAYGLVQLIEPTARKYGAPLGLRSDPRSLKQPEVNLRIGARFVRDLWKRYGGNVALIPAAYNAGSGATDKWLAARTTDALDEWIEQIPYGETRRYTRRVLQSYSVYAWLDGSDLPRWPLALPKR